MWTLFVFVWLDVSWFWMYDDVFVQIWFWIQLMLMRNVWCIFWSPNTMYFGGLGGQMYANVAGLMQTRQHKSNPACWKLSHENSLFEITFLMHFTIFIYTNHQLSSYVIQQQPRISIQPPNHPTTPYIMIPTNTQLVTTKTSTQQHPRPTQHWPYI